MILCTLAAGTVLAAAPTASADRAPVVNGKCTSSSTSKIKAKLDDGRIEHRRYVCLAQRSDEPLEPQLELLVRHRE